MKSSKELIIDTAIEFFTTKGFDATSVHEICQAAGVSKGTFYYYFESKNALFQHLLQNWLNILDENLPKNIATGKKNDSVFDTLTMMAQNSGKPLKDFAAGFPLLVEYWRQAMNDPSTPPISFKPYERYDALFTGMLLHGIAEGSIDPETDPRKTSRFILAVILGYLLMNGMLPNLTNWSDELVYSTTLFRKAVEAK